MVKWDAFEVVPRICHQEGVRAYLYVTLFDEGWPLLSKKERNTSEEAALLSHPSVTGLVFSTFRYDNPKAIERGDWRA